MLTYIPNSFSDIASTPLGQSIWEFLNEPLNVHSLKLASKLQRPAVEGITDEIFDKFGEVIKEDRTKQMIGHMIRQILENNGFHLQSSNIKVRYGNVFSYGSKYSRNN